MVNLNSLHEAAEVLERRLRLKTFPLAVKMLETEGDIAEGATRPKRDLGHLIESCQGFAMSRREGKTVAMLKEDMWCFEPVVGYGLAEPPQEFLEGRNRFPDSAMTLEIASTWAHNFPRLKFGKYIGAMSAPLMTVNFQPDLVILYCDPSQLTNLLIAVNCVYGRDLTCRLSGHAACVYSVVPAIQTGECQVTSPCWGDRREAIAQDYEVIFTVPIKKLEGLLSGLKHLAEHGWGLPIEFFMAPEPKMPKSYIKIGKTLGMKMDKAEAMDS